MKRPAPVVRAAALLIALAASGGCGGGTPAPADGAVDSRPVDSTPLDAAPDSTLDSASADAATGAGLAGLVTCDALAAMTTAALAAPGRDSEGYEASSALELEALARAVVATFDGDGDGVLAEARSARYEVCRGLGDQADLVLFTPSPGQGRARFVLRFGDAPGPVFGAPHPIFDTATLEEARVLFERTRGRALLTSGTHRCANAALGCSGRSTVCGADPAAFHESDMAHSVETAFQRVHVALAARFDEALVVSVHGFTAPGASLSDGTNDALAPGSPVATLATALASRFADVTTCNAGAGVPTDERFCGTTNVQGRHINGVADACGASATSASGRFVHLEQNRSLRDAPERVADAFVEALDL